MQHRFSVIPVLRIRHHHQLFIHHAILQHVGAITHQVARFGPVFTACHVGFLHRIERKTGSEIGEPRQRLIQLHSQGAGINSGHTELIGRHFAINDRLGVIDPCQRGKPGKGGQRFRIHQALPAIDKILGGHRRTI
ncbi:hypothetical protein SDC9_200662 [bioreactor metagenome]|uniref:Uncharacterized protein n=1 Tax=bioreactor metagenome TaxID=1076179 RepID=A0A645IRL7_9ZZZZ